VEIGGFEDVAGYASFYAVHSFDGDDDSIPRVSTSKACISHVDQ
jgi:hypothetical protein